MNIEKQRSFCDWKTISLKGIQYFLLGWIFNIQVLSCCLASFVSFTGVTVCWYYWRKLFSNIHQSQMFTYDPLCHTMCSNNSHLRLLAKYFCKGYLYATQKAENLKNHEFRWKLDDFCKGGEDSQILTFLQKEDFFWL